MRGKNSDPHPSLIARCGSLFSVLCLALIISTLTACQTARVEKPLTLELAGDDAETQLEFWHRLATRPVTSNDEAFHGLLLYLDTADPTQSYDQRVALLRSRDMLPKNFDRPGDEAVRRGVLAVAIVRALQIRGGVLMHVVGPIPRYATRELVFLNLYPPSSPHQTFSGSEFVGIMGRIEDYQRVHVVEADPSLLPAEAEQQALPDGAAPPAVVPVAAPPVAPASDDPRPAE